ncbi:polysaccharide biosynthesis C-terminal domain-containing protein [Spirosoma luteolum]
MSTFKKLAGDTALYGLSTIVPRMINFALVPLQTTVFTRPGELSSNVVLYSYVALMLAVYTFGLETAFFRGAARAKGPENAGQRDEAYNNTQSLVLLITGVCTLFILLFSHQIAAWLDYRGQERSITWVALLVAIDASMAIPFARLRVENKAREFVTAKIVNVVVMVGLNFFFLLFCRDIDAGKYLTGLRPLIDLVYDPTIGPGYIFLANLLANLLYVIQLRKTLFHFRFQLKAADVRALLVYSFPLMLTALAGLLNTLTDRIVLAHWLPEGFYPGLTTDDAVGIYGNCYKLSVFMALAIQSFKFAADPFFFAQADDKGAPELLGRVTKWFVIVCVVLWVGVSLNLDAVGLLMLRSPLYRTGLSVVPILLLANLFLGVYYNIAFWFKLSDKTRFGTIITVIGLAVTIVGNLLLIPTMGYMGCALAFLASSVVMTAVCYLLGEKYYPVPYHVGSALGYIIGAGTLIWASLQIPIANLWIAIPFHLALFLLFLGIVVVVERDTVQQGLARFRRSTTAPKQPR